MASKLVFERPAQRRCSHDLHVPSQKIESSPASFSLASFTGSSQIGHFIGLELSLVDLDDFFFVLTLTLLLALSAILTALDSICMYVGVYV